MTAIKGSFTGLISTYNYYGGTKLINRDTEEGVVAVDLAITYL